MRRTEAHRDGGRTCALERGAAPAKSGPEPDPCRLVDGFASADPGRPRLTSGFIRRGSDTVLNYLRFAASLAPQAATRAEVDGRKAKASTDRNQRTCLRVVGRFRHELHGTKYFGRRRRHRCREPRL